MQIAVGREGDENTIPRITFCEKRQLLKRGVVEKRKKRDDDRIRDKRDGVSA